MREGTASGPLSTTPRHICQIRGISPTREPRIAANEGGGNVGGSRLSAVAGGKQHSQMKKNIYHNNNIEKNE